MPASPACRAETRQRLVEAERSHAASLQAAHAAAAQAESRLAEQVSKAAQQRHAHSELLQALVRLGCS